MLPTFRKAVDITLTNWNPLQFAVQQQTGGKESKAIAEWMVGVIEQFFYDNDDLEPEEVADYVSTIMDQELNTQVEDDSDLQVGTCLCHLYQLCVAGKDAQVVEELSKMPKCDLSNCKVQDSSAAENEVDECPQLVTDQLNRLELEESQPETEEHPCLDEQQLQDEAEGWTVIRKGKRK